MEYQLPPFEMGAPRERGSSAFALRFPQQGWGIIRGYDHTPAQCSVDDEADYFDDQVFELMLSLAKAICKGWRPPHPSYSWRCLWSVAEQHGFRRTLGRLSLLADQHTVQGE